MFEIFKWAKWSKKKREITTNIWRKSSCFRNLNFSAHNFFFFLRSGWHLRNFIWKIANVRKSSHYVSCLSEILRSSFLFFPYSSCVWDCLVSKMNLVSTKWILNSKLWLMSMKVDGHTFIDKKFFKLCSQNPFSRFGISTCETKLGVCSSAVGVNIYIFIKTLAKFTFGAAKNCRMFTQFSSSFRDYTNTKRACYVTRFSDRTLSTVQKSERNFLLKPHVAKDGRMNVLMHF